PLRLAQLARRMPGKERRNVFGVPIEHHVDIAVTRGPRVFQKLASFLFEWRREGVAQPVKSFAKRSAPGLIPAGVPGVTATVGTPALDAVNAAPRAVLKDFHFVRRWMPFQVFPVIRDVGVLVRADVFQSVR